MASEGDATTPSGPTMGGPLALENMEVQGLAFVPTDLAQIYNVNTENNIFEAFSTRARMQEAIYLYGDGADLAAIKMTQEIATQLPVGTAPRTQVYEFVQRAMFAHGVNVEVIQVGWDQSACLDRYDPGDAPGVWDLSGSTNNIGAMVNAICAPTQMDKYTVRGFASNMTAGRNIYDKQGVFLPMLMAAKINRDHEEQGLEPLAATVPVNEVGCWSAASLGSYTAAEMGRANNKLPMDLATFRNKQVETVKAAQGSGAIPLRYECFNLQERLNINSIASGGVVMNAVDDAAKSIGQYFSFVRFPIMWWSAHEAVCHAPNAPVNNAQPEPQSSQWWLNLVMKLAEHLKAYGCMVRASVRLSCMITGVRRETNTGTGSAASKKRYWVMAMQQLAVSVPQPRGSSFLTQLFGSDRGPSVDKLFLRDFEALRLLFGRSKDLFNMFLSVGAALSVAFSTVLLHYNITGRELGNKVCTGRAWCTERGTFNNVMEPMFEGGAAGFCAIINQACTMVSVFTTASVNVLCLTGSKGWCNGLVDVATCNIQDSYWFAWYNGRVPFHLHPFVIHHLVRAYAADWGLMAPNSVFNFSSYWGRGGEWIFDTSRLEVYKKKSLSRCRYTMVPEGALLINAALQRSHWGNVHDSLVMRFRAWHAATGAPAYPGTLSAPAAVGLDVAGGLGIFAPGTILSFDWATQNVMAPVVPETSFGAANISLLRASPRSPEPFVGVPILDDYGTQFEPPQVGLESLAELLNEARLFGNKKTKLTVGTKAKGEEEGAEAADNA